MTYILDTGSTAPAETLCSVPFLACLFSHDTIALKVFNRWNTWPSKNGLLSESTLIKARLQLCGKAFHWDRVAMNTYLVGITDLQEAPCS